MGKKKKSDIRKEVIDDKHTDEKKSPGTHEGTLSEIVESTTYEEEVNWCILMCQMKLTEQHYAKNAKDKGQYSYTYLPQKIWT